MSRNDVVQPANSVPRFYNSIAKEMFIYVDPLGCTQEIAYTYDHAYNKYG